jgi:hypothetical protein
MHNNGGGVKNVNQRKKKGGRGYGFIRKPLDSKAPRGAFTI